MIEKCKIKLQNLKFLILSFNFAFCIFNFAFNCYAKEIAILYTGETHAMLYPCSCPIEPDGGVARRATLIKELRKNNPDALVLDSGGFFAGGLMDEYTQNAQLDTQRTEISLKAMEMMNYDAANIGDDEFNFGREFLEENINNSKMPFLSCNIQSDKILPFVVKDIEGIKVGIIGVTGLFAMQKAGGLNFNDPKSAVKKTVEELKKKNTNIIVLLSHLGESEDMNLIKDVQGIDILIIGHSRTQQEPATKIGGTLLLRPSWQGRRLGKLSLTVENNKVTNYKVEELRLSAEIVDDRDILSILPACFSDINCRKKGFRGVCQNPGASGARCLFTEAAKLELRVIAPKQCKVCNAQATVNYLEKLFGGIVVSYLYYPDTKAAKLISDFGIKALPVFLFDKQIEKEAAFDGFKKNLEIKGNFYMLKPEASGIAYFLQRKKMKGKLDIFISLYEKGAKDLLDLIKEYSPAVHFLAIEQGKGFDAARGNLEVEEYLRAVCVQKYYPDYFWDYITCRARDINSSWWEDCADKFGKDQIKTCARGKEGAALLKENIGLNKEMRILFGPTCLLDNQEIFAIQGTPKKEELKKILNK